MGNLKKWETPVFSVMELNVRTKTLVTDSNKILSEPRPKPPGKEKGKKGDKNKDKKNEEGNEKETVEDAGEKDPDASSSAAKPQKRKWRSLLKFLLPLVVIVPIALVFAGYGEPYGISSPWPFWPFGQADGGGEDFPVEQADSAEVEGAGFEPVELEPEIPIEAPDESDEA